MQVFFSRRLNKRFSTMEPSTGWGWLWQGIISNWIFWAISLIAGLLGAYLKSKGGKWLPIVYNGLLAAGLVGLIIFNASLQMKLSMEEKAKTTVDNIENKARSWLDKFQISTQSQPDNDVYFRYVATTPSNVKVTIARLKRHDQALVFYARIIVDPKEIDKLSSAQQHKMKTQIIIEMAKLGFAFNLNAPNTVLIQKAIPITPSLTETEFMTEVQSIDAAITIVRNILAIYLEPKK